MASAPTIEDINATESLFLDLPEWHPEYVRPLAYKIRDICVEAKEKDGLNLSTLRCISIRDDFALSVHSWQRALGIPEVVTSMESGQAGGKAMSWKTPLGETRSGIIVSELVAAGIVQDIPLSKAVMIHELAHIHDDAHRLTFDTQVRPASALKLSELLHDLTHSLWSEYFADRTAARHYSEDDIRSNAGNAEMIREAVAIHSKEKEAYRFHGNHLGIWQQTLSTSSISLGVIGRFLGQFTGREIAETMETFEQNLPNASWANIVEDALMILNGMYAKKDTWDLNDLKKLDPIVQRVWAELGVIPEQTPDNLFVRVP